MSSSSLIFKIVTLSIIVTKLAATQNSLICHTHDDLGWLRTIDEYYEDSVSKIFDSVLTALETPTQSERLKRKFVYSEVGFLKLFIEKSPGERQSKITRISNLIKTGQWEFVNGGISQSDEACPHYEDIIVNYFYGLRYLKKNFNATSNTCWQLDPFGQSKSFHFIAAKFGMNHTVFGRISTSIMDEYQQNKALEFIWKFPDGSKIIAHSHFGYYPPDSLSCDSDCKPENFDQNKYNDDKSRINNSYKYNNFFTIGGDFHFKTAEQRFRFLDHVIELNQDSSYATFKDFREEFEKNYIESKLNIFEDDFFVYQEGSKEDGDSWSGYFTTKPRLKRRIKRAGLMIRALKTVAGAYYEALGYNLETREAILNQVIEMCENFGVLLHHDAITGTSVEHVDADYHRRITDIEHQVDKLYSYIIRSKFETCDKNELMSGTLTTCSYIENLRKVGFSVFVIMNPTITITAKQKSFFIPNDLQNRKFKVVDDHAQEIPFSLIFPRNQAFGELTFEVNFPLLNGRLFQIFAISNENEVIEEHPKSEKDATRASIKSTESVNDSHPLLNERIEKLKNAGELIGIVDFNDFKIIISRSTVSYIKKDNIRFSNDISYVYKSAFLSGHYILNYRNWNEIYLYNQFKSFDRFEENGFDAVYVKGTNIDLVFKMERGSPFFTIRSHIKKDSWLLKVGVDVMLQASSKDFDMGDNFYTDSNGYFEMKRQKNLRFENRVFPVTSFLKVEDKKSNIGIAIFPDRAEGATVDKTKLSGNEEQSLLFYIQRSANQQDHKGNKETLKVREDIVVNHMFYNFKLDDRNLSEVWVQAENFFNLEFQDLFASNYSNLSVLPKLSLSDSIMMDRRLKLNVEFVSENKVLWRINNISRTQIVETDVMVYLRAFYPQGVFKKVDFAYIFNDDSLEEETSESYVIEQNGFLTILVKLPEVDANEIDAKRSLENGTKIDIMEK